MGKRKTRKDVLYKSATQVKHHSIGFAGFIKNYTYHKRLNSAIDISQSSWKVFIDVKKHVHQTGEHENVLERTDAPMQ